MLLQHRKVHNELGYSPNEWRLRLRTLSASIGGCLGTKSRYLRHTNNTYPQSRCAAPRTLEPTLLYAARLGTIKISTSSAYHWTCFEQGHDSYLPMPSYFALPSPSLTVITPANHLTRAALLHSDAKPYHAVSKANALPNAAPSNIHSDLVCINCIL